MSDNKLLKGERSRNSLLDAAYPLFINQGYSATSMRQISDGAQLALGGIYNHFPSKESVFQAILMERIPYQKIMPLLKQIQWESCCNLDRTSVRNLMNELGQNLDFFNLLLVEIVEFKGKHLPELFEKVFCGVPPPAYLHIYFGMFISYHTTQSLLIGTMPSDMQEHSLDAFIDTFLYGILKSESAYEFSSSLDHT